MGVAAEATFKRQFLKRLMNRSPAAPTPSRHLDLARGLFVWAIALVAVLAAESAFAQGATPIPTPVAITMEEYDARLEHVQTRLNNSINPKRLLPFMVTQLAQIEAIRLPTGEVIFPENLLGGVEEVQQALALVHTTRTQMYLSQNDRLAERQAIVAAAVERTNHRGGFSLWNWLEELWRRLLNWLFGGSDPFATASANSLSREGWRVIIRLITVVGGIVIAVLLGWWIQRLVRSFVRDADLRRRREAADDLPATAAEARTLATEQARTGSYRVAVRTLYLSALLSLEEADLIIHDRTLTNRELLARAGSASTGETIQPAMRPVVQGFDDVWYGEVEPDADSYAAYETDIARLNQRIGALDAEAKEAIAATEDGERGSDSGQRRKA